MTRIVLIMIVLSLSTPVQARPLGAIAWALCKLLGGCVNKSDARGSYKDPTIEEIEQFFNNSKCLDANATWVMCENRPKWLEENELLSLTWNRVEMLDLK